LHLSLLQRSPSTLQRSPSTLQRSPSTLQRSPPRYARLLQGGGLAEFWWHKSTKAWKWINHGSPLMMGGGIGGEGREDGQVGEGGTSTVAGSADGAEGGEGVGEEEEPSFGSGSLSPLSGGPMGGGHGGSRGGRRGVRRLLGAPGALLSSRSFFIIAEGDGPGPGGVLYERHYDGNRWIWVNHGHPPGVMLARARPAGTFILMVC
jgi:hypothetical protein